MPDAEYYRAYRASHPEYRQRERERLRRRKAAMTPEERRKDRGVKPSRPKPEPLPVLFPGLQRGSAISFWEDELKLDLVQEKHLAVLQGADPQQAVAAYRRRELAWRYHTCPFLMDGDDP